MTGSPDIFLSYSREDHARAEKFALAFKAAGLDVWWDMGLRAGEAYDEVTEAALRNAKAVVVLWSKRSVMSRWVRAEATLADRNKTLVPAMIDVCERPIMFELTHTAELMHWQGATDDRAWLAFLSDVQRFVARAPRGGAGVGDTAGVRKLATILALEPAGSSGAGRQAIDAIIASHGGRVFAGEGVAVMAEFGASLAGAEAAFALAEACQPAVRVGVHLGDVTVEADGVLSGDGVKAAARLVALCEPGSLVVSGPVRYTMRGPLVERLASRGFLELDGLAGSVEMFAPARPVVAPASGGASRAAARVAPALQAAAPDPALLPYVGRTRELERVRDRLERATRGDGGLVLISGEAGVGKTRLTQEAERIARSNGFLVTRGHSHDSDTAPPYQPLLEQLEQARRILGPDAMRPVMGANATELSKLMPELRQLYNDIPPYPSLPPEQERRYLLNGIAEFLARGATYNTLLVVFEDLHWADESTCILLRHLAERLRGEPVLLMGTYRDGEVEPGSPFGRALQALTRERLSEDIKLGRLSRRETGELLEKRFGVAAPKALVDLIYAETEGNPFFIEEVIGLLHDSGKLLTETGAFRDDIKMSDAEVAQGIRLIIEERIGKASPLCREVLTLAAVTGRTFSFDLVVRTEGKHSEDEILTAIEEAVDRRLIEDVSQGRITRYQFVHEQIRQTLLASLSRPRRQRLHLRIADALEAAAGATAERVAADIGHHLYQAGTAADHVRTARFLTIAGERAIDALAFEDALRQFDLALGVLEETDDALTRARLHGLRAMALHGAERIPESLAALKIAVLTAPTLATKDEFTLQRCNMLLELWRGSEALADLEGLQIRARQAGDPKRELRVQQALARAYYVMSLDRQGFADKSKDAYEATIALARSLGERRILGNSLVATATLIDYWPGYVTQARANVEEAGLIAQEFNDEGLAIDVDTARLSFVQHGGPMPDDESVLQRALALRDPVRLNAQYFRMMWSTLRSGRIERCVEICDAGIALAYRIGTLPVQYPTIKALALMELGRLGEASDALGEEIADEAHRFGAALRDYGRVFHALHLGDVDGALGLVRHVIDEAKVLARVWMLKVLSSRLPIVSLEHPNDPALCSRIDELIKRADVPLDPIAAAALAFMRGDAATARKGLAPFAAETVERLPPAMRIHLISLLARLEAADGDYKAAREQIRVAVSVAREKSMRSRLWRLLGEEALLAGRLGDAAGADALAVEARRVLFEVAQSVPDEILRARLLTGAEAQRLGLVG